MRRVRYSQPLQTRLPLTVILCNKSAQFHVTKKLRKSVSCISVDAVEGGTDGDGEQSFSESHPRLGCRADRSCMVRSAAQAENVPALYRLN